MAEQLSPTPKKDHESESEKKSSHTYGLIRFADIPGDSKPEILDLVTGAIEKHLNSLDVMKLPLLHTNQPLQIVPVASRTIKEQMDRQYGPFWHVVIGANFGFDINYQTNHILYMFFGGNLGILLWKCC